MLPTSDCGVHGPPLRCSLWLGQPRVLLYRSLRPESLEEAGLRQAHIERPSSVGERRGPVGE